MDAIKHLKGHLNFYLKEEKLKPNTASAPKPTSKPPPETKCSILLQISIDPFALKLSCQLTEKIVNYYTKSENELLRNKYACSDNCSLHFLSVSLCGYDQVQMEFESAAILSRNRANLSYFF